MIKQLYIRNFTLIEELDIAFQPGFSVITGETGAGKSIILGAIALLLGNRADVRQVKAGKDRCVIEAHFEISRYHLEPFFSENDIDYDATDCILRREVNANGKSRAFINDTPVALTLMRELGERLVDIHSQHQNLLLNKENFQLSVIDTIAEDKPQLDDYQQAYRDYHDVLQKLEDFRLEMERNRANEDFMRFQLAEFTNAGLQRDEQEQLEQQSQTMTHAEDIKSALYEADQMLQSGESCVVDNIRHSISELSNIAKVFPAVSEIIDRLNSCHIELKDIAAEVSDMLEGIDYDPRQLEEINQRLDTIFTLQQKHHVSTIEELLAIQKDLEQRLSHIDNGEAELEELQQKAEKLKATCQQKATKLTAQRTKAAKRVEKEMQARLVPLGIPNVRFQVELSEKDFGPTGTDKVSFLFSANKSTPLQPVSEVASGGEIARVMLSLKAMISGTVKLPTIIFDEIDTGVSGRVAEQMAQIMLEMGQQERQVISITHLPQIAAKGQSHYKVSKLETPQGTQSGMTQLSTSERIQEIAQMLSGSNVTEAAIANAKQLLETR
ncbi:MAG: DNA repair protein RecN [Prevotella sp.]|nr:DNA repair protein RecN [Prevotella sp.]